ncbi:AP-4 complex accessory subunit Tepsin-like [Gigantopelta aegis]|uniref:AP-4 complex accessory subunit Tepsin-like n=1 Tax=Gigantopelta aegis TaxID=1735272 RepID=UPI001B88756B|nr:AP-4 complex accessory subunit Tepsin-like [Gigantopelta aegis]
MSESGVLNLMSDRISFVNKISVILKATSDDDTPVPGYMYQQISDISHESVGYCESLLEFLVERLDKNSYHVKLKVLKLMKYIIENGHANFQIGLRKMSHGIQAATKFGGPPDPLHGNVPYAMVRKEAQGICEKLFNVEVASSEEVVEENYSANKTYNIVGMGPSSVNSGGGRIEGFGNYSSNQQKSLADTIIDGIGKLAERLGESPVDKQKVLLDSLEKSSSKYCPPVVWPSDPLTTDESGDNTLPVMPKKVSRKHVPGRAGGGWDYVDPVGAASLGQDRSHSHSDCSSEFTERLECSNLHSADWSTEVDLVNSTVEDESRPLLTRQEIATFQNKCASLNTDKIVEFLAEKLYSPHDYIVLKSLLLVENFLRCDLIGLEFLAATCKESLLGVYMKWEGPCRAKARKIIRILEKLTSHQNILAVEGNGTVSRPPASSVCSHGDVNNGSVVSTQTGDPDQQHGECAHSILVTEPLLSLEDKSFQLPDTEQ